MGYDDSKHAHHEPPSEKWVDTAGAQTAFTAERDETFADSIKKNKRAVLWSLMLSTAIIMEGYDTSLLPSFYGYPSFQKHYGDYYPDIDGYQLSGPWQAGLSNGANVYCNLCWAIGQLIANGILQGLVTNTTKWGYRIPGPFNGSGLLCQKTLARLTDSDSDRLNATISQMVHTIEIEREIESGSSYWHCFKGIDLRRTEICCLTFATQMLSGAQFAYGPSYFFLQAGMDTEDAYKLAVGSPALAFLGTVLSWLLLTYFGRRTIFLGGISTLAILLFTIGMISATTSANNDSALWAQASLCLIWQLVYSLTLGPIAYVIISETSAVRLRAKSVVLARNTYNITTVWAAVLEPYMIHPKEWDWKGKTAFSGAEQVY
ncbi:unnamed protein product [Parascedosporium putredinis]|uniref:Maltose permease n=1 Tax=Parascedosporium putredinis TaxID=1442378 RepID=A0A9P1H1Y7_9PEZI|nr:unnamed protein product [Parascedosporium putredinis]CAI7993148.1 unnamed protein product [Parascedosporium putredinis]